MLDELLFTAPGWDSRWYGIDSIEPNELRAADDGSIRLLGRVHEIATQESGPCEVHIRVPKRGLCQYEIRAFDVRGTDGCDHRPQAIAALDETRWAYVFSSPLWFAAEPE